MRKQILTLAVLGLGISSAANAETYTITGGNWDSVATYSTNATGTPDTKVYDNGEQPPPAVLGGNAGILNWMPSDPSPQTGTYSGTITTNDVTNEITGGNLIVTGTIGKEIQVGNNSWWFLEYVNLNVDFGAGSVTGTVNCVQTAAAPAACASATAGEPAGSWTPSAGLEGAAGAARPAGSFDGTTLVLFSEGYDGSGGSDYLSTFTLTTGAGGPGASGGDITEAGEVLGVGNIALATTGVTSGAGVEIINAATGLGLSTIEYFDNSSATWTLVAIDTVADANSDGTADDAAVALLAQNDTTGQIIVQTRAVSDGSKVGAGQVNFFNNSTWTPIDVAVVNDINGDGTTGDTGIAVLAESTVDGRYQVRMKLLSNGSETFKQNYFTPAWTVSAIEGFTAPGGGNSRIAALGVDGTGAAKAMSRQVSDGAFVSSIWAFGAEITPSDLGVAADGDSNGTADDPALLFLGTRAATGVSVIRSNSAATGAHLKTATCLDTGYTPDAVTTLSDIGIGAGNTDEVACSAVDGSDVQTIKVRDYATNFSLSDILP